jgi:hypothetical protein
MHRGARFTTDRRSTLRLPMRIEKRAALGALGACGGIALLYLLFVWLGIPRPATAGIDRAHGAIVWISLGVVVLALIALHLALAHQLWHAPVRETEETHGSSRRRRR